MCRLVEGLVVDVMWCFVFGVLFLFGVEDKGNVLLCNNVVYV